MKSRSMKYGSVTTLSAEKELELSRDILSYRKMIDQESGNSNDEARCKHDHAVNELVKAYSPLIERIAREHYSTAGSYGGTWEDFISEAYLVAVQCARSFDPTKGQSQIRFSSYVSRAISSTLIRMSMRSRSVVSVPVTVMTAARKWSHTRYEAMNRGMEISDADVSALSGVDMSQSEVQDVLGLSGDAQVEDLNPPLFDTPSLDNADVLRGAIRSALEETIPDRSDEMMTIFGLNTGRISTTAFMMSSEGGYVLADMRTFMPTYLALIHHPIVRMSLMRHLTGEIPTPDSRKDDPDE